MTMFLTILASTLASTGLWTLINNIYNTRSKKKTTNDKALMALLHDKIYYLCERHLDREYITTDEYENLLYLYEPYKELGGNGTCEKLMSEVKKLDLKKKED